MTDQECRTAVSDGCRVLAAQGLGDAIWGHVSLRDPEGRGTWLKRADIGFEEVGPDDVHLIDDDGSLLDGEGRVHYEFPIHTEVLAARPDLGSVVHAHPEASVAFASTGMTLRPIGHEGALFTAPALGRYTDTGDLIRSRALGADVARTMATADASLLVNHGVVTAGADVAAAVLTAVFLEKACRMQLAAAATGQSLTFSDDEEAVAKRGRVYSESQLANAWAYMLRDLDRR